MRVMPTEIAGVMLVEPLVHGDERGYSYESFRSDAFEQAGLPRHFVQDAFSRSSRGTLRGLHLQHPFGQGKLVAAIQGEIVDVAVDLRRGSPSFGHWVARTLTELNKHRLYIPPGFAHGFLVLSELAVVFYRCTEYYHPEAELGVAWNDPQLAIDWGIELARVPLVSPKDERALTLAAIPPERLPVFEEALD